MTRGALVVAVLAVLIGGLVVVGRLAPETAAQPRTDGDGHPIVGSWLPYETNPPNGGEPVLIGVATFTDDGAAVVRFGDEQLQGAWRADEGRQATFTAVAPGTGGFGELDQLRA